MARAELHFHLLPGVDDGPATWEESVELARAARGESTRTIVATPHVRGDFVTDVSALPELTDALRRRLARERIAVDVIRGAELGHDMVGRLSQDELETIALGPPRDRWLLVETPFEGIDDDVHAATDELRDRGFAVVLAHPERSDGIVGNRREALCRELERGALLQVNAPSLIGDHGTAAKVAAEQLLTDGLVDVLASDAHSLARGPALTSGVEAAVMRGLTSAAARRLTDVTPARLISRGIPVMPPPVVA